jgi:hypothetical protein
MPPRFQIPLRHATAAASRATTDLLTLPWPFSQRELLTADQFVNELNRRGLCAHGWQVDVAALEELHRLHVLVPLFEVRMGPATEDPELIVPVTPLKWPMRSTGSPTYSVYSAARDGRLLDPGARDYRRWPRKHRWMYWPHVDRGYAYSVYQLLALDLAASLLSSLQPRLGRSNGGRRRWEIPAAWRPDDAFLESMASWRALAVTLSAIDTVYWPPIAHRTQPDAVEWRRARAEFNPRKTAEWLGISREGVLSQADSLRVDASDRSVLGDFYDIVRRARRGAWNGLRGGAAVEIDLHGAAEILERFGEEIGEGAERPFPPLRPEARLDAPLTSLDAALTELHVSPHPSLVLALEGKTEMLIVPRVMELLGISLDPAFIHIVNIEGTKDLSLLAQYAGEPRLGVHRENYFVLDRPVTRFLLLHDAENDFSTRSDRHAVRKKLLQAIAGRLPKELHPEVMHRSSRIVEIMTWGPHAPFEFAHFTDEQLATGLLTTAGKPHPRGKDSLLHAIHMQRTADPAPDIEKAWRTSGVRKVALAETMWPLLERRIVRAMERGQQGPPVMRAALRANKLAVYSRRSGIIIREWGPGTKLRWGTRPL